mmetsp:Transcript_25753/g.43042  ORF Transcript_25753/g.43042 Transcript_25753/m.43042 type:complete len:173 (+) Transcript_25753:59-577(+)
MSDQHILTADQRLNENNQTERAEKNTHLLMPTARDLTYTHTQTHTHTHTHKHLQTEMTHSPSMAMLNGFGMSPEKNYGVKKAKEIERTGIGAADVASNHYAHNCAALWLHPSLQMCRSHASATSGLGLRTSAASLPACRTANLQHGGGQIMEWRLCKSQEELRVGTEMGGQI